LEELFSGRQNSVGLIRLTLALAVVVSHSRPLGFGDNDLGLLLFKHQSNVGAMAVYGFFILSGMLITRSSRRGGVGRYAWHRGLRIFPGLWVCLIVTACVVAPLVALHERDSLAGFWDHPGGPFDYIRANWWTGVRQYGVSGLLEDTPYGKLSGRGVFDGALWSLVYEMICYIMIGVLAATGVIAKCRAFVLFLAVWGYLYIWDDYLDAPGWAGAPGGEDGSFHLPLFGYLDWHYVIYLGFLFLLGAVAELYRERIPINDALGVASGVVLVFTLLYGGFFVAGLPAYAYLLLWLAIRLPKSFQGVGTKNDYSYGIYIYGFVAQQLLAMYNVQRWGFAAFAGLSVLGAFAMAFLSWHLVEKPALRLKRWQPSMAWLPRRKPARGSAAADTPTHSGPAAEPALAGVSSSKRSPERDAADGVQAREIP
jgi:peptidoglycan/LPS O-acetylase OafA/YrhL